MPEKNEIISIKHYKAGYEVRTERVLTHFEYMPKNDSIIMKNAYTLLGHYIGDPKTAHRLCAQRGIAPELAHQDHNVCSIGFSKNNNMWWGWSHRAICGFRIGDIVKEGDCTAYSGWTEEYLKEHPEEDLSLPIGFKAQTLKDAKKMAIAFAESVS